MNADQPAERGPSGSDTSAGDGASERVSTSEWRRRGVLRAESGGGVANLSELLERQAGRFGAKSVFRFLDSGADWSFADLERRSRRVAGQLGAVAPGDRVGILAEDRAAFCDAFFGAHARGVVPVPLGVAGTVGSAAWRTVVHDRVARFGLAAVLTDPGSAQELAAALAPTPVVGIDGDRGDPAATLAAAPHAFVQPSSGTTGDPKGVVIGHGALLANLAAIGEHWDIGPTDVGISWLPLFHDMGLIGTMINALYQGGTLYHWPTASFLRSPGRFLQLVGELGVTITVAPPFALQLVTRRQQRRGSAVDLSGLRSILVGAELIRPEVLTEFTAAFAPYGLASTAVTPSYGLAEATVGVTAVAADRPFRIAALDPHPAVSCGVPLPGVEVACTAAGEVIVRSPGLMDGYLDDPDATAATIVDGWLHTGDTGVLVDGELVVLGRTKEMINRGGLRLPASDFELALAGVDGLLPDRVVAFADSGAAGTGAGAERVVVLAESRWTDRAGEAVLAARAALADAGLPVDVVELVRPGFIPRTTSGKLRRAAARDAWIAARVG
jgi:fatty-acyl-CoA synthase